MISILCNRVGGFINWIRNCIHFTLFQSYVAVWVASSITCTLGFQSYVVVQATMLFNFLNLFRLVFSILYSYSNCVSICCVANISLLNASYSVVDWLALIIPLFAFVINLVLHLFTFYSFLVFSVRWKKSPYHNRQRFLSTQPHGLRHFQF